MAKKKIDRESAIDNLQKQIDELDEKIVEKIRKLELPGSANFEDVPKAVEKLKEKKEKLEEKLGVLQLQGEVQEKISSFMPFISVGKDLLAENKGLLIDVFGILLDAFCDVETGVDSQLAKLSKISAKNLFREFTDLTNAGFNENQAMALLLASKIKISDILQVASQSTSRGTRTKKEPPVI